MKTQDLEGPILDYYVALAVGHTWRCKWMLEKEGYNAWQSYENGWGNPTPPYSTDWAAGGPVIESHRTSIMRRKNPEMGGNNWSAVAGNWNTASYGKTALIAAMRAVVALHHGNEVPDVAL